MSQERHSVRVVLGGIEFALSSEHPPEYTREVAAYFDAVLTRIRNSVPSADAHKGALLAGLAITDELFQARRGDVEQADRLAELSDRLGRLIPPAKRGSRAPGATSPAD